MTNAKLPQMKKTGIKLLAAFGLVSSMGICADTTGATTNNTVAKGPEKRLNIHNKNTGERLNIVYKRGDTYDPQALRKINYLLRDHREGKVATISLATLDRMYAIGQAVKYHHPDMNVTFEALSGYRTQATNRKIGSAARRSEHMHGTAIDFRIPGVSPVTLRNIAVCTGAGGTGYYASGFIHIDSGATRKWNVPRVNCGQYHIQQPPGGGAYANAPKPPPAIPHPAYIADSPKPRQQPAQQRTQPTATTLAATSAPRPQVKAQPTAPARSQAQRNTNTVAARPTATPHPAYVPPQYPPEVSKNTTTNTARASFAQAQAKPYTPPKTQIRPVAHAQQKPANSDTEQPGKQHWRFEFAD